MVHNDTSILKPTPVIKFISWIYLLIGMENFFWAIFRFIYEGRHGHLTRSVLNATLAMAFIVLAVHLSRPRAAMDQNDPTTRCSPAKWAWGATVLCFVLQYYRFTIWTQGNVNNLGISDTLSQYFTIVHMYDTWFAMMASLVLAQEYRRLTDPDSPQSKILHWEMTSGSFRQKGWFRKSLYLELNAVQLNVRTNLFWMRQVPLKCITEVRDVPMVLYPPYGIGVRYQDGERQRQVNFLSEDYAAWFSAFEQLNVPVRDEAGVREKKYLFYRWWRFYSVAKAAVRAFIVLTVAMTVLSGLLGPILNKDYGRFSNRLSTGTDERGRTRYRDLSPGYAKSLRIRSVTIESDKITLKVDHALRQYNRAMPAYFNHLFRDTKIVLYPNVDHTHIRFKADSKLKENRRMTDAGFLYAFPIVRDKTGSYRYRFVYVAKIENDTLYLKSIETTYHKGKDGVYWKNVLAYKVDKDFEK